MITYVLIFYMSIGYAQVQHGGPATIDGFSSQATCEAEVVNMKKRDKVDFAYCIKVVK